MKKLIDKLPAQCSNSRAFVRARKEAESMGMDEGKKDYEEENKEEVAAEEDSCYCQWKGKHGDLKKHLTECSFEIVKCTLPGCKVTVSRCRMQVLTHLLSHSRTHALTHSRTQPPTHPLTHSPTHPFTHSPNHSRTCSLSRSPSHTQYIQHTHKIKHSTPGAQGCVSRAAGGV